MNQLSAYTAAVRHWFLLNGLRLNASKSEAMMLGTAAQLQSVGITVWTVDVAGTSLPSIDELKTLGVMFDSHFRYYYYYIITLICNAPGVRIVTKSDWRADVMPILRKLLWLPKYQAEDYLQNG
jgi:hypothetical protein